MADALAKGATAADRRPACPARATGSSRRCWTDVNHGMEVMREESFGTHHRHPEGEPDDDEAVRLMNDTRYGLTAGVYTPDAAARAALLSGVNAGSVYWNCCDRVSPRLPWSAAATRASA